MLVAIAGLAKLLGNPKEAIQIARLLLQLVPDVLKVIDAWKAKNGGLSAEKRKALVKDVREAVKVAAATKDTSKLEALLGGASQEKGS